MNYLKLALLTSILILPQACSFAGTPGQTVGSVTVDVTVTIRPSVELSVDAGRIDFGEVDKDPDGYVMAESGPITVSAKSNLRTPYVITHELHTPLTNAEGNSMPDDSMTVEAKSLSGRGTAAFDEIVDTSKKTLYTSDHDGLSESVEAKYKLKIASNQNSGTYDTRLTYSMVTA